MLRICIPGLKEHLVKISAEPLASGLFEITVPTLNKKLIIKGR